MSVVLSFRGSEHWPMCDRYKKEKKARVESEEEKKNELNRIPSGKKSAV